MHRTDLLKFTHFIPDIIRYDECYLLGCDVHIGRILSTFRRNCFSLVAYLAYSSTLHIWAVKKNVKLSL
jgi:hypothetical protein